MPVDPTDEQDELIHPDWDEEFSERITPRQEAVLDKIAKEIVDRRMAEPAIMFLETVRPLNWIASQVLLFFEPYTTWILGKREVIDFRRALQNRNSIQMLIEKIETYYEKNRSRGKNNESK